MAKNKVINTVLNLRDNMSGGLIKAARNTKGVTKEMMTATRQVVAFKNKTANAITSVIGKFSKLAVAAGAATAGLAAKTGFSEAMNLEGYRMQLETATKSAVKASKIMRAAIDLANRTPFEGGEMVEAASKFEAMGMAAEYWMARAGDMAAATNKDLDQSVEALIDAQSGELERLKEFGITKAMITDRANQMYRNQEIVNKKGQIVDQKKFNDAMVSLMEEKFTGGMEKQSRTMKGLWSTVTGVTKNALAQIVGISSDGSVRAGSAYELIRQKVKSLADRLQQWQSDGTLDRLSTQFQQGLTVGMRYAATAAHWLTQNGDKLLPTLQGLAKAFVVGSVLKFSSDMISTGSTILGFIKTIGKLIFAKEVETGVWLQNAGAVNLNGQVTLASVLGSVGRQVNAIGTATAAWIHNTVVLGINKTSMLAHAAVGRAKWLWEQSVAIGTATAAWIHNTAVLTINKTTMLAHAAAGRAKWLWEQSIVIGTATAAWIHNTVALGANKVGLLASAAASGIATGATTALTGAQKLLNLAFVSTPIGWIVLGLMAVVAAGVALYKNWDTVKGAASALWGHVTTTFGGIRDSITGAFSAAKDKVAGFFSWLNDKVESVPVFGAVYKGAKSLGGAAIKAVTGKNALGTSYWRGGPTRVHERGGEILDLPGGTRIIPHDVSQRMTGGPRVAVYVTVQGNIIGNAQYADELGDTVVAKILRALDNI